MLEFLVTVAITVLVIFGTEWAVKKLAKKHFLDKWKEFSKEKCKEKEFRLWLVEMLVAIVSFVFWVAAYKMGLWKLIKDQYVQSAVILLCFMPVWVISAILWALRNYIKERFPEDCTS